MKTHGVECPECGGMQTRVKHSSLDIEGNRVRQRDCEDCGQRFGTVEVSMPGLSYPRTQRSKRQNGWVEKPQYVKVTRRDSSTTLHVVKPQRVATCRKGLHPWIPENKVSNGGRETCLPCRRAAARNLYHHARRNAPPSILEEQRAYWRKQYRKRAA